MKKRSLIHWLLALIVAFSAADAWAQGNSGRGGGNGGGGGGGGSACEDVLIRMNQTRSMVYDPLDDAPRAVEVELSIDSPGQSLDCELDSVILSQTTPQPLAFVGPSDLLQTEQVRDPMFQYRQRRFELSNAALRALEQGTLLNFALVEATPGQFVSPGTYVLPFTVEVNGAAASTGELAIDVIPNVYISVFGKSSRVTTLDFGELETGETKQSVVLVKTNARLRVTAISDNGGELKHETVPGAVGVPYTAFLDGEPLDVVSGTEHEIEEGQGHGEPQVMKLLVQIGDVNASLAGTYTDVLTLQFTGY